MGSLFLSRGRKGFYSRRTKIDLVSSLVWSEEDALLLFLSSSRHTSSSLTHTRERERERERLLECVKIN